MTQQLCLRCGGKGVVPTTDEVTERIAQAIADAGLFKKTALELAGINPHAWKRRAGSGKWYRHEIESLARVCRVPVEKLTGEVA